VATCDQVIQEYIQSIGGSAVMTATTHNRATTRSAEALEIVEQETGQHFDIMVMVQGDEPLISPEAIGQTLQHFEDPTVNIVNIMSRMRTLKAFTDKNNVKVVVNYQGDALYFSREPIPSPWKGWDHLPMYMQTGIIAFRHDALLNFNTMEETTLEQYESVDMNRVLETGGKIRMVPIEDLTIGVDIPDELAEAEIALKEDPYAPNYLNK
jgi:3-deoxy-manno-octulosonate cytidylyltransferase (CMP-KDO synthetase)